MIMWHVKYTEVLGSLIFHYEYASGYIGHGTVRHAVDKHLNAMCRSDQRRRKLHVRFDTRREPITCQRCLMILKDHDKLDYVTNWEAE